MKVFRLLDTPPMTAAENMAMDETLLELKGQGKSPDTLRFLQFSPRTVLVGFHQAVSEEIRVAYCREHHIDINRRITGGGAILFDEKQLGWEVFCEKSYFNTPVPNTRFFKTLCDPVILALEGMGVKASFRPRNDIEIKGRKISGTGGTESDDAFMFQGTLLIDFDVDTMLKTLQIPLEKLKDKEIASIRERVTCLKRELGKIPPLSEIKQAFVSAFETALDIRLEPGGLTPEEKGVFEKKLPYFQSPEWIEGVNPRYQKREAVQAVHKAPSGMVRFTLMVNPAQNRLKDIYITGDFFAFPANALYDLESELRGASFDRDDLHGIIYRHFDQERIRIPGMDVKDFVRPLDLCLEQINAASCSDNKNQEETDHGSFGS